MTQLFTEPYMVSFLLDNSLGAWWAARRLSEDDLMNAESEEELRRKASLPGVPLDYLRFVRGEDGRWAPAAGTFDGWPQDLKELKVLDPCCGSGHFLVAALPMLASMRAELEKLSAGEAVDAVLRENLHGLEIDPRCVELAAFALAFAAWRYPGAGGYRMLPELNLACSGLPIDAKKEEWSTLTRGNNNMQIALDDIYEQFRDAPLLGGLIDPKLGLSKENILGLKWDDVSCLLSKALLIEKDYEKKELGISVQGITKAALLLTQKYSWVITNVPFLGRSNQNGLLKAYLDANYPKSKTDLATAFLEHIMASLDRVGYISLVCKQEFTFQPRYSHFRIGLLENNSWNIFIRLGPRAFETISGERVNVGLFIISKSAPNDSTFFWGQDVSNDKDIEQKKHKIKDGNLVKIKQSTQLLNPDATIILSTLNDMDYLGKIANSWQGIKTSDDERFCRKLWELRNIDNGWILYQRTARSIINYSGRQEILLWEDGYGKLATVCQKGASFRGISAWGKKGIALSMMGDMPATIYTGEKFSADITLIEPKNPQDLPAIWLYCSSSQFHFEVRKIDQSLKPSNSAFLKVPFNLNYWQKVAAERYPNGLPRPYSDDPTQWIFHGHPAQSDAPLQVAVARLLGYRWPAELDPEMELSDEARAWVKRCNELLKFADDDGIVCIPPVRGEAGSGGLSAQPAGRGLRRSLEHGQALRAAESRPTTRASRWRAGCGTSSFEQHCKLFHHRPFIWHIWDGLHDGFAALVNYHKLDAKLSGKPDLHLPGRLDHPPEGRHQKRRGRGEEKLAAAEALKKRLELILEGEAPYDIFVRWKPLHEQPIGWDPDLNDGVRLNIRPFLSVPDVGRKGAGVLREKPNINWNKDRGKDVESAPWYHRFGGDRINDCHLLLEEKRTARETKAREGSRI